MPSALLVVFTAIGFLTAVTEAGYDLFNQTNDYRGSDCDTRDNAESDHMADRLWRLRPEVSYNKIADLRFCFDFHSERELLQLFRRTVPERVVADNVDFNQTRKESEEEICGDWDSMEPYICQTEQDYFLYFRFVLNSDDPEKIPDTEHCSSANLKETKGGCLPGFFDAHGVARKCCEGFFCPQMMHCMIPCPVGAYCPRAHSAVVPDNLLRGLDTSLEERVCVPYGYQERIGFGCGGANKWAINPKSAFYPFEDNRGNIYCPSGQYCEDTISEPKECEKGFYCRPGSVKPTRCPLMTFCDAGAKLPEDYFGLVFDGFIFVLLAIVWQASRYYNYVMRWLSSRERIRIHWRLYPMYDIAPAADRAASTSSSAFGNGPPRSNFKPKLVSVYSLASLSRTLTRRISVERERSEHPVPVVWGTLSEEMRPFGEDDEPTSLTQPPSSSPVPAAFSVQLDEAAAGNVNAITIDFYAVTLKAPSIGKLVVGGASGKFAASRLTVIMGPSGCGKSSLLNYLTCQGHYSMTNGVILLNNEQATLKRYRKVMGFVPQDDIVHPLMTIEENLIFSARYRLPRHAKREDHLAVVDRAITLLGLMEVRNQLVGNEECRGVSGGQRKRVNIGLELVADPWILFLDEPTSGLDSSSCRHVMSLIGRIAHMGVTCAAIVHQPSNRVLRTFDDLLLLSGTGRTVYYGPQTRLKEYFLSLGFHFPLDENPADVFLDIITRPKTVPISPNRSLTEIWETSEYHHMYISEAALAADLSQSSPPASTVDVPDTSSTFGKVRSLIWFGLFLVLSPLLSAISRVRERLDDSLQKERSGGGYKLLKGDGKDERELRLTARVHTQFWLCFYRCTLERTRSAIRIFLEYALYAVSGMILGILSEARSSGRLKIFVADMNNHIVAIALMTTVGSLRTFTQNRLIMIRESRSGLNKWAYYAATALFGDVGSVIKGLCYLSLYYSYAQPRARFSHLLLVTTATIYCCCGFGYFISQILRPGPAQLAAAVFVLTNGLLASSRDGAFASFVSGALYHRWAIEAYTISEAKQLFGTWSLERCMTLSFLEYDVRHFPTTIIALALLGIITRMLSFGVIVFGTRDKTD